MKQINLIDPEPQKLHAATVRWMRLSKISIGILLMILLSINAQQLLTIYMLHTQQHETILTPTETSIDQLIALEQELTNKHAKLLKKTSVPRTPLPLIETLSSLAGSTIELSTIQTLPKREFIVEGTAPSIQNVTEFINALNDSPYCFHTKLSSLQPETNTSDNRFQFSIKGSYKLTKHPTKMKRSTA